MLGIILVVMVLLIAICTVLLNSKSVHNRIVREATSLLSKKLGTRVDIDSASVDIVSHDINLYGLVVDDQQQRKMLLCKYTAPHRVTNQDQAPRRVRG